MSRRKRVQAGEVAWKRKAGAGSGLGTPSSGNVVRADEIGLPKNTQVLLWHTRKLLANMDGDLKTTTAGGASSTSGAAMSGTRKPPRRLPRKRGTDLKPVTSSASEGSALFRSHSADAASLGSHHKHMAPEPRENLGLETGHSALGGSGGGGGTVAHSAHTRPEEDSLKETGKASRRVKKRADDGFDDDFWGEEGQRQRAIRNNEGSRRDGPAEKRQSAALAQQEQESDSRSPARRNLDVKGGATKGKSPRRRKGAQNDPMAARRRKAAARLAGAGSNPYDLNPTPKLDTFSQGISSNLEAMPDWSQVLFAPSADTQEPLARYSALRVQAASS